jgi:hypothetical protein
MDPVTEVRHERFDYETFVSWMCEGGWKKVTGGRELTVFTFDLSDRQVVSFASYLNLPNKFQFTHDAAIVFYPVRRAVEFMLDKKVSVAGQWWTLMMKPGSVQADSPSRQLIDDCTSRIISWAQALDPQQALMNAGKPLPMWSNIFTHVAAVALLGNAGLIRHYIELRKRENLLGLDPPILDASEPANLHPIVKIEHLERALFIANGEHPSLRPRMSLV